MISSISYTKVTLKKTNFTQWIQETYDFDLIHLDISNTGNTIKQLYKKYSNSLNMRNYGMKALDKKRKALMSATTNKTNIISNDNGNFAVTPRLFPIQLRCIVLTCSGH